ncbi:MAG: glycosyltransferase family 4 protein, partial [Paracoccaceae bacterium]
MNIVNILPRHTNFEPLTASSISLVARDLVRCSRFQNTTTMVCREIDDYFDGFRVRTFAGGPTRQTRNQVLSIIADLKPDLIVMHQNVLTAAAIAAQFPDVPLLVHKHNYIKHSKGLKRYIHHRRYRNLAGIIFVSEALRADFAQHNPNARPGLFVVHNGLPLADWPGDAEKSKEIVAVGMVEEKKGSLEIAKALARVLPEFPDWRARFVGAFTTAPGYADRMKREIAGCAQISSSGFVPFSQAMAATNTARIAIVNSRNEPFGRVAIEAFAARTALICAQSGGLGEVIADAAL